MSWLFTKTTPQQRWLHLISRLNAKGYKKQASVDLVPSGKSIDVVGCDVNELVEYCQVSLTSNGLPVEGGFFLTAARKASGVCWVSEMDLVERLEKTLDGLWRLGDELCGGA